jgi:hypothetical protein
LQLEGSGRPKICGFFGSGSRKTVVNPPATAMGVIKNIQEGTITVMSIYFWYLKPEVVV